MKKRVLLALPHLRSSPFGFSEPLIPNGLGFIASTLERGGHTVRIVDNYLPPVDTWKSPVNYSEELQRFEPDFVGISVNTIGFGEALELIQITKASCEATIICGGPHATLLPTTFPRDVDYVVIGEGEIAVLDIVEGQIKSEFLEDRYVRYPEVANLDDLPMPAWHHFVGKDYQWDISSKFSLAPPTFSFNASRGCSFRCKFCSIRGLWETYRTFSPEKIVKEIEKLIDEYGARSIYFREDNFVLSKKRTMKFCDLLRQEGIKMEWAIEARIDIVKDKDLLGSLAESGCKGIEVGVESGSQRILDLIDKRITVREIEEFFELSHDLGVSTYASVIYGIPGETEEDREQTESLLDRVKPNKIRRGVYLGLPGSHFYEQLLRTRDYERIEDSGIIYPKGYRELAGRIYDQPTNDRTGRAI